MRRILPILFSALALGAALPGQSAPFSEEPAKLLERVKQLKSPEGSDVHVLEEESVYRFDEQGRCVWTWRRMYAVLTPDGVENWASLAFGWAPWYQKRPVIKARVITPDGKVHWLDEKNISENAQRENNAKVLSDGRVLRAPLPAVSVGSVVEESVDLAEIAPMFSAGTARRVWLRKGVPMEQGRITVEAPAGFPLFAKTTDFAGAAPADSTEGGRRRWSLAYGPFSGEEVVAPLLPPNVPGEPVVEFTTAKSWQQIAARYHEQVEAQIAGASLPALPAAANRRVLIAAALAWVHKEVRYTGVEFGEAALVPATPAEVLKRHFGDCKDKAALLVALLRRHQIRAHVALLQTGPGYDVNPEVPGMGVFDHAIVHVPAAGQDPAIWIDATAEYAPLGELPTADRGRWALLADPATTQLVETPALESKRNLVTETREFRLADLGAAQVIETSEYSAHAAIGMRPGYASPNPKEIKENLDNYAKTYYLAEGLAKFDHSDATALDRPFQLRLEINKAVRGSTDTAMATVAVFPTALTEALPAYFGAKDDEDKKKPPRTQDFYLSSPYVAEWRYRIVPPTGFVVRAPLPADGAKQVGTATFTTGYKAETDGSVSAVFRFDSGPQRIKAADGEALKKAVIELREAQPILLNFDHTGEALLAKGDVPGALAEFRRLQKEQPKRALHHSRAARAILAAGLGDEARREAEAATKLEPESAQAWRILGSMRYHDRVGRPMQPGMDYDGAVAAYKRAIELDPGNIDISGEYGILLEHDKTGGRYAEGARLAEAVAIYKPVAEKLDQTGLADNYDYALLYHGDYETLLERLAKKPATANRRALQVAAAGRSGGAAAALKQAASIAADSDRRAALSVAGQMLLRQRQYAHAADILDASTAGTANAAAGRNRAALIRNIKRFDRTELKDDDPASGIKRFMLLAMGGPVPTKADFAALLASPLRKQLEAEANPVDEILSTRAGMARTANAQGLTLDVMVDLGLGASQTSVDGDPVTGHRVRLRFPAPQGNKPVTETSYVVREDGRWKLLAIQGYLSGLAHLVKEHLGAGRLDSARKVLDWARESSPRVEGEDPLSGTALGRLWEIGAGGDAAAIRLAAAALDPSTDDALDTLEKARAGATEPERALAIDLALMAAYENRENYEKSFAALRRARAKYPQSDTGFVREVSILGRLGRWQEARDLVAARLKDRPDNETALRAGGNIGMAREDTAEIRTWIDRLDKAGLVGAQDLNNLAWGMFVDRDPGALAVAQRGLTLAKGEFALLHTTAAILSGDGKLVEARGTLLDAMQAANLAAPNRECLFVMGIMAEKLGLTAAARDLYTQASAPGDSPKSKKRSGAWSSSALARKRMADLPR